MARTALTPVTIPTPWAGSGANTLDFTFTAADVANKNYFVGSGKEIILAYNSDGVNPYTFSVTSVDDEDNRAEDITTYSLTAGEYAVVGVSLTNAKGWKQTNGQIYLEGSNAAIKFCILRLPAGYPA